MVGDSLRNDVDGALAAGLRAIWLNRDGRAAARRSRRTSSRSPTSHALPGALA